MIDSIRVKNFKCFEDETFPLGQLTVLSGINGMGKSSFMQSLLMLRQSALGSNGNIEAHLNGPLVDLGFSDDVLFEGAKDQDDISFELTENSEISYLSFNYKKRQRILPSSNDPKIIDGSLFGSDFFYLTAERIGPRTSFESRRTEHSPFNSMGNSGEYCAWLLSKNERKKVHSETLIHPSEPLKELRSQVEAWLSEVGQTPRIHIDEHPSMDRVNLQFSFLRDGIPSGNYRPTNVGFGLTYALPIFVSSLLVGRGGMLCIENPEAHLHPRAQSAIGYFLGLVAASGVQVILETHSDHLLNGIRVAAKNGAIEAEDVSLLFFHREEGTQSTTFSRPILDKDGRLDKWPEGFFDEWENRLAQLL